MRNAHDTQRHAPQLNELDHRFYKRRTTVLESIQRKLKSIQKEAADTEKEINVNKVLDDMQECLNMLKEIAVEVRHILINDYNIGQNCCQKLTPYSKQNCASPPLTTPTLKGGGRGGISILQKSLILLSQKGAFHNPSN